MSDLWRGGVMTALVVGAIVLSLIIFTVLRYRRRGRDDEPSQRQYVIPLEIVYTIIPIVIVLVLFGFSWVVQDKVDALSKNPDVTIDVQGFQWQWQFHYRDEDITVTGVPDHRPVMVLPVNETIRLVLTSRDVIHSFYVPGFLFKRDVIPTITNQFDLQVEKAGTYRGYCAEFCGLNHARMTFTVHAVSKAEYDDWVAEQS
jgi:cytochrome c oxidase subunit II